MKLPRRKFLHLAAGATALPTVARIAWAQAYPTRPVRLIVPIAPAGAADITARLIGQWLSERLGQPFIIESRPGAATNFATEAVVRAAADGYTLLLVHSSNAMNATLYEKLNFNFIRDIAPVATISRNTPWRYILRCRPKQFQSSSSRQIRARSTWHRPAAGLRPKPIVSGRSKEVVG
jgi:tripartite-type tricarboxylate transporter receptor subunit TctC